MSVEFIIELLPYTLFALRHVNWETSKQVFPVPLASLMKGPTFSFAPEKLLR